MATRKVAQTAQYKKLDANVLLNQGKKITKVRIGDKIWPGWSTKPLDERKNERKNYSPVSC